MRFFGHSLGAKTPYDEALEKELYAGDAFKAIEELELNLEEELEMVEEFSKLESAALDTDILKRHKLALLDTLEELNRQVAELNADIEKRSAHLLRLETAVSGVKAHLDAIDYPAQASVAEVDNMEERLVPRPPKVKQEGSTEE